MLPLCSPYLYLYIKSPTDLRGKHNHITTDNLEVCTSRLPSSEQKNRKHVNLLDRFLYSVFVSVISCFLNVYMHIVCMHLTNICASLINQNT